MECFNLYGTEEYEERASKYFEGSSMFYISTLSCLELYGLSSHPKIFFEHRLMHHSQKKCDKLTPNDTVECLYMFGETVLITTHKYGQCPYKLKG